MPVIKYALREDPLNVYQLAVGTSISRKQTQISIFRRREIAPGFLSDFYYLDSRPHPQTGRLTEYGEVVKALQWENPYNFIVTVDCQIEFIVRRSLFEKLQDTFAPVWTADTNINFYSDQPSGYIVLLRVFQTDTVLDTAFLEKGRLGSAQVMRLYDKEGSETQIHVNHLVPVISEARFSYLKDEIISCLKRENALIAIYENTEDGRRLLQQRIEADRSLRPKYERNYDTSSTTDMAHLDYSAVYGEILEKAPGLKLLIDYVKEIQPAQWGEIDKLVKKAQSGDQEAWQRLFDTHLRVALKSGLWASERYNVDLEDAIQEAIIGLTIAIDKYEDDPDAKFGRYAPMWMRQNMMRALPIAEEVCRLPAHFLMKFIPIVDWIREHEHLIELDGVYYKEAIMKICECFRCNQHLAVQYLGLALPTESIEALIQMEDIRLSDNGRSAFLAEQQVEFFEVKSLLEEAISSLKERNSEIIRKRFGFDSHEMTLEEIGSEYGLTRERIRQIEAKGLQRIQKSRVIMAKLESYRNVSFDLIDSD